MLLTYKNIIKILPIVRFELYNKESSFIVQTNFFSEVLVFLKKHFKNVNNNKKNTILIFIISIVPIFSLFYVGNPRFSIILLLCNFCLIIITNYKELITSKTFKSSLIFFISLIFISQGDFLITSYIVILLFLALTLINLCLHFWGRKFWTFYILFIQLLFWFTLLAFVLAIVKKGLLEIVVGLVSQDLLTGISFITQSPGIYYTLDSHLFEMAHSNNKVLVNLNDEQSLSFWFNIVQKSNLYFSINWVAPYLNKIFILSKATSLNINLIIIL